MNLQIRIDRKGSVEVNGLRSEEEAWRVAEQLGITSFYLLDKKATAIRGDEVTEAGFQHIRERARILGVPILDAEELSPVKGAVQKKKAQPTKRPEARPAKQARKRRRQTMSSRPSLAAVIMIPLMAIMVVGVVAFAIRTYRDMETKQFSVLPSLESALVRAQEIAASPPPTALRELLNPDDSRYISFRLTNCEYLNGPNAIAGSRYLRVSGLESGIVESLFRTGSPPLFRIDARLGKGIKLHVLDVLGAEDEVLAEALEVEAFDLPVGEGPSEDESPYRSSVGVKYDDKKSFDSLKKLSAVGYVEPTEDGLSLVADGFNVALRTDLDPGLLRALNDVALSWEEGEALHAGATAVVPAHKRLTLYLELVEIFPWSENGTPLRRQLTGEIGMARVDGVQLGAAFVDNPTAEDDS